MKRSRMKDAAEWAIIIALFLLTAAVAWSNFIVWRLLHPTAPTWTWLFS